jgi:hypothetical protein
VAPAAAAWAPSRAVAEHSRDVAGDGCLGDAEAASDHGLAAVAQAEGAEQSGDLRAAQVGVGLAGGVVPAAAAGAGRRFGVAGGMGRYCST